MIALSRRIGRIVPSPTAALLELKSRKTEQGIRLLDFGAGEPDFDTPEPIRAAGIKAIESGLTRYTATQGSRELRKAIVQMIARDSGLDWSAEEVIATPGSKYALFMLMQCLVETGDEVILPRPYWVSYPQMVSYCGAAAVYADHCRQDPPLELLAAPYIDACTPRTKLVVINSPANPSGASMSDGEVEKLLHFFSEREVMVVFDDCYRGIHYGPQSPASPFRILPRARSRIAVVGSLSKTHAMTGWRIGYAVACPELIRAMTTLAGHSSSNPCSISQYAAQIALTELGGNLPAMNQSLRFRRDLVCSLLEEIGQIPFLRPRGAFYLFPDFSKLIGTLKLSGDEALALALLEQENLLCAPGSAFGAPGHLRFSFAAPESDIREGFKRMGAFIRQKSG